MDFDTTLNEFENYIWRDETPSDQMLDRMMALCFQEGVSWIFYLLTHLLKLIFP